MDGRKQADVHLPHAEGHILKFQQILCPPDFYLGMHKRTREKRNQFLKNDLRSLLAYILLLNI